MWGYFFDLVLIAGLIIGITAMMGVIVNTIGEHIGRKSKRSIVDFSNATQRGWKMVGGKNIYKKKTY